jgi:hypothetical protein
MRSLETITVVLESIASRSKITRLLHSREDAATIQGQMRAITTLIQNFLACFPFLVCDLFGTDLLRVQVEAIMSVRIEANVCTLQNVRCLIDQVIQENALSIRHDINEGREEMAVCLSYYV